MKRHEALQPFSRDHNVGLVIARRLTQHPSQDVVAELLEVWDDEMRDHFAEEERLLIPLAPPELATRLVGEHRQLESLIAQARVQTLAVPEMKCLGELLADHIRWEERVLFPALEAEAPLQTIASEMSALEERRASSPHSPRRAELVQRSRHP